MNQTEIENDLRQLADDWKIEESLAAAVIEEIEEGKPTKNVEAKPNAPRASRLKWFRSGVAVSLALMVGLAVMFGFLGGRRTGAFVSAKMLPEAVRQAIESVETAKMQMTRFDDSGERLPDRLEYLFDRKMGFVRGVTKDGVWKTVDLDNGEFNWACDFEKKVVIRRPSRKGFEKFFDQSAPSGADYERLEKEDIQRGGQSFACYARKNLAPFSDGPQRAWVYIDSNNLVQESRTWKFKNDRWNLVRQAEYAYNVEIDAARFDPKFESELKLVDIERELDTLATLNDCLFSREVSGLTYKIHRATPLEGGGLAVFSSLRETSPKSAQHCSMWSHYDASPQFGNFFRIVNAEAMDSVRLQWFLLAPRKQKWRAYDSTGQIVEVMAADSIVDGKRVSFEAAISMIMLEPEREHQFKNFNVQFEFDRARVPVSLKDAASLIYREQQQIPNVSFKLLHTGVKLVNGVPTGQRGTLATTSEAEFQQAVVDHLGYWRDLDIESKKKLPGLVMRGTTSFGDGHFSGACARKDLVHIDVSETSVTDAGMKSLLGMNKLEKLNVSETAVTDESIEVLIQLKSLKRLDISGTEISTEGISRLKASLKTVEIEN